MLGDDLGDSLADMRDGESVEQAGQAAALAGFNPFEQIVGGLLSHPLQIHELIELESIEVPIVDDQLVRHELIDQFVPQPLDIHRVPRGEKSQSLADLSRAIEIAA